MADYDGEVRIGITGDSKEARKALHNTEMALQKFQREQNVLGLKAEKARAARKEKEIDNEGYQEYIKYEKIAKYQKEEKERAKEAIAEARKNLEEYYKSIPNLREALAREEDIRAKGGPKKNIQKAIKADEAAYGVTPAQKKTALDMESALKKMKVPTFSAGYDPEFMMQMNKAAYEEVVNQSKEELDIQKKLEKNEEVMQDLVAERAELIRNITELDAHDAEVTEKAAQQRAADLAKEKAEKAAAKAQDKADRVALVNQRHEARMEEIQENARLRSEEHERQEEKRDAIRAERKAEQEKAAEERRLAKEKQKRQAKLHALATGHLTKFGKLWKNLSFQIRTALLWGTFLMPLMQAFTLLRQSVLAAAKQNAAFVASVANLKGAVWTAAAPSIQALSNALSGLIDKLAVGITYVGAFINALFGLSAVSKDTVKGFAEAGKESETAGKKADKSFASWDTVQQLQGPQATGSTGPKPTDPIPPTYEQDFTAAEQAVDRLKQIYQESGLYGIGAELAKSINNAFMNLDTAKMAEDLSNGIKSAIDFVLGFMEETNWYGLGEKFREFLFNIDWLGIASQIVIAIGDGITAGLEFLSGLMGIDFSPIVEAVQNVKDAFVDFFDLLAGDISLQEFAEKLSDAQLLVVALSMGLIIGAGLFAAYKTAVWAVNGVVALFSGALKLVNSNFGIVGIAIAGVSFLILLMVKHWDELTEAASWCVEQLDKAFEKIFYGIHDFVEGAIKGVKSVIWIVLLGIQNVWNTLVTIVNAAADLLKLPDRMKERTFADDYYNNNVANYELEEWHYPHFATGGVVNPGHKFAAILGDNNYEREIVSPLSTMKQAFMEALRDSGMTGSGTVVMEIDGNTFARVTYPYNQREVARVGMRAAGGGV